MPGWLETASPWVGFFAVVICVILLLRVILQVKKMADGEELTRRHLYSVGGALLLAAAGIFLLFFSARAGTAEPVKLLPPELIDVETPTTKEIIKDYQDKTEKVFEESSKSVEDLAAEADDYIDKALKRAQEQK